MYSFWLGIGAFVLYLIYDINSFTWKRKVPETFFLAGTICLAVATVWDLGEAWCAGALSGTVDVLLLGGALASFVMLIYTLFFALPFKETYTEQSDKRRVYSSGVYALCRHPGILCFFGTYLLLGLAALPTGMISRCLLFSGLNLAYAWFQDRITFPKTFFDYSDYQKQVPFLIPTKASISVARETLFSHRNEEDAL